MPQSRRDEIRLRRHFVTTCSTIQLSSSAMGHQQTLFVPIFSVCIVIESGHYLTFRLVWQRWLCASDLNLSINLSRLKPVQIEFNRDICPEITGRKWTEWDDWATKQDPNALNGQKFSPCRAHHFFPNIQLSIPKVCYGPVPGSISVIRYQRLHTGIGNDEIGVRCRQQCRPSRLEQNLRAIVVRSTFDLRHNY